ncbi:methyltransferase domain-containing protein [Rhodobacter sp. NTK016B]|uniref:class I SAM-dependent methyltransferase n=1 Tax=Rhodobacter sp. NTK016B TaxID=2759676 RepID=UPI001A8ECDBA|nr:methyltransferase domain-containing protein [Rhodobacter sp. NTK016B]MBN8291126.1 methyltransferase domain-containing protein [Rhodobacter sp. NTK016B]
MLISDSYRALNEQLHNTHRYGERGDKWAKRVRLYIERFQPESILDYGCGKGALKRALQDEFDGTFSEYDPAIPEKSARPEPADLVVCTDVLEHIEPECINAVIDDLAALARVALFVVVSTRPAVKTLADGRNAHLIIQPLEDWLPLFTRSMTIVERKEMGDEFALLLTPGITTEG